MSGEAKTTSRGLILAVAESRGSCEALAPVVAELRARGCVVRVLATGTEREAEGFGDVSAERLDAGACDNPDLLRGCSLVLTGLTGPASAERRVAALARSHGIPVAGVADNADRIHDRVSPDARDQPDIVLISTDGGIDAAREELRAVRGPAGAAMADRMMRVGNLRGDGALSRRAAFSPDRRIKILTRALGAIDPERLDQLVRDEAKLVTLFTQNMRPDAPHWASYGLTISERRRLYRASLAITARVLSVIGDMPGVIAAVRPHPGEDVEPTRSLCADFGAVLVPPSTVDSLDLALAAGHIVSPASSMLDQGPLLGVRTLAILWDQDGPFRFNAIDKGALLAIRTLDATEQALSELVAGGPDAQAAWSRRLRAINPVPAAPRAAALLIERFGLRMD
jgi:hypothetical protein